MPSTGQCASSPIGSARSSGWIVELGRVGHELARDRIVRIGAVDQLRHRRRDGDGILRGDFFQRGALVGGGEPGGGQIGQVAQGFRRGVHGNLGFMPASGHPVSLRQR